MTTVPPESIANLQATFAALKRQIHQVIVGQDEVIDGLLTAILAGGHVLLEGVPGLGKTLLLRTFAKASGLTFSRVQFTPDLMPADVTGTMILAEEEGRRFFRFAKGPVFANVVLADEVNRATPKTQSALLEAMEEAAVTVAGESHKLPAPFVVLATQNPIEMEGTYPLPEAQLDRFFFKLIVPFPGDDVLQDVLTGTTGSIVPQVEKVVDAGSLLALRAVARAVPIASSLTSRVVKLIRLSHEGDVAREKLRYGASVRAGQAMILAAKVRALVAGRAHVEWPDLAGVALPALRHRLILSFEAEADGVTTDDVVAELLEVERKAEGREAARTR